MNERRAAIDVGSNSVLLLVSELRDGVWVPIREETDVTALGEGVKVSRQLGQRGMAATLIALKNFFGIARDLGCDSIRAGVTMAGRLAENTPDFLLRARAQGTPAFVLSGDQEAELGFRAIANDPTFAQHDCLTMIDVGGQSTEIVTSVRGNPWHERFRRSFPVGTLGLRGSVLPMESPDGLALLRASKAIDDQIGMEYLPHESGYAIVMGATGTNLITIRERMTEWEPERVHGQWLDYEEVSKAVSWLSSKTDVERAAVPGMEKGREKTIHLGSLILERCLFAVHALGCGVSVRGWRHALLEDVSIKG